MKAFLLSLTIILCSYSSYSQTKDSIVIFDQVVPQNFYYPAKPVIRGVATMSQNTVISYRPVTAENAIQQRPRFEIDNRKLNQSTIVVIDNKIYSVYDRQFRELNQSHVLDMNIVKDESSTNAIKTIILIKTK